MALIITEMEIKTGDNIQRWKRRESGIAISN